MTNAPQANVKELRLATVLYGGVSLCIYMHGITKEIHRLVRASRSLDPGETSEELSPVEDVYRRLLDELAIKDGVRTRVVVDVVAGTSAGGLNGVFLAKALAHNLTLEPLLQLWLGNGSIAKLLTKRAMLVGLPAVLVVRVGLLGASRGKTVRAITWLPKKVLQLGLGVLAYLMLPILFLLDRIRVLSAPLSGDKVFGLAFRALGDMGGSSGSSLMREDHLLELFVTTTDIEGYNRRIRIWRPREVVDQAHRHVLTFRYRREGERVELDSFTQPPAGASPHFPDAALALAARSTSCFPGAFPPISVAALQRTLKRSGRDWTADDAKALARVHFRIYELSRVDLDRSFFFDGGVLDNRPFELAINAIAERPAWSEVDRKLVYLEPHPVENTRPGSGQAPRFLRTVTRALMSIPRAEPILDDLVNVRTRNDRIARVQAATESSTPWVEKIIAAELDGLEPFERPLDLHARAKELLGPAYITYATLKLRAVLDQFATVTSRLLEFPADSNQAAFVRRTIQAWGELRGLARPAGELATFGPDAGSGGQADSSSVLTPEQIDFLKAFDLGYGRRRIRFVIGALNDLYDRLPADDAEPPPWGGPPTRADLDGAKKALWDLRIELSEVIGGTGLRATDVHARMEAIFGELRDVPADGEGGATDLTPAELAKKSKPALDEAEAVLRGALEADLLSGFDQRFRRTVEEVTRHWLPEPRREVFVRFEAFPIWDALLYPIRIFSELQELDKVEVVRLSPDDAGLLESVGHGASKLAGTAFHHFGAFFTRSGRERDYLWGRLDGAEQLIGLMLGVRDPLSGDARYRRWSREAFLAVLEEESGLSRTRRLRNDVRETASAL